MIEQLAGSWNYIIVVILMMTGLFMVIARANLVKKDDRAVNFSDLGFYLLYFAWQDGRRHRADS